MHIAFVGCGYAADFYAATLKNYPHLKLIGVFDKNEERINRFSLHYSVHKYTSLDELLADSSISIVVNLTNVREHYSVTKACLNAGKHVYSEKPLAAKFLEAEELFGLARNKSLQLACAPANLLSESGQTAWKLLREGAIGEIWLAYAELDDGAVHQMNYRKWYSESGTPWPFEDEFETGCVLEHAVYHLIWLTAFLGPAKKVDAFSTCLVPDKIARRGNIPLGGDLSISCITFHSGIVARLTCSTLAPKNHALTIVGSEGVLTIEDCWQFESPIYIQKRLQNVERFSDNTYLSDKYPIRLERPQSKRHKYHSTHDMDFARGIAELADAIQHHRPCRLSAQHILHVTEILSSIVDASVNSYEVKTSFPIMYPEV